MRERLVLLDYDRTTWEWDGRRWWKRSTGPDAPAQEAALAWDPVSRSVLAFGGFVVTPRGGFTTSDETWSYDGVSWQLLQPSQKPLRRYRHAMTTDTGRGRVVLFGGEDYTLLVYSDTWEWTGTDWIQVAAPGSGPQPLDGARLAYDPLRQRCVLFGGNRGAIAPAGAYYSDTWDWDGSTWQSLGNGPLAGCHRADWQRHDGRGHRVTPRSCS